MARVRADRAKGKTEVDTNGELIPQLYSLTTRALHVILRHL